MIFLPAISVAFFFRFEIKFGCSGRIPPYNSMDSVVSARTLLLFCYIIKNGKLRIAHFQYSSTKQLHNQVSGLVGRCPALRLRGQ